MKLDLSLLFLPPLCYWDFSYSVTTRAFFVDPVRLKTNNGGCFSPFLARFVSIFNFTSRHVIDDALTHLARYLRKSVPACIYFSSCFVQTCQCSCLYLLFLLFCPDSVPACIYFSSCFVQTCQCSCLYLLFLLFCPDVSVFLPVFTFPLVLSRRVSVPACIYFSSCFVQTCQCSCLYLLFLLFCPDVSVFLPVFTFPLVLSRRVSVPACIYFSSCFVQTCQCSCLYLLFLLFCPDVSVLLPVFAPDPHWVLGIDIWKRDKLMSNHTTCRADLPSCSLMTGANGLVFMQCESTESWSAKQTLIL